ncbi:MAG: HAMP domain-containing histidine kinase [Clostridiales Family XIII bacterium]|jgi:signal transduction histidine kinase|nr:HAMP domain-containing histidine kinase [Clostridiales Family XIII bacterium]
MAQKSSRKPRIDRKSLRFKLGTYFFLFTGVMLLIIWALQSFFLNNYYQEMKIRETMSIASKIELLYRTGDAAKIRKQISDIYESNDMYIDIETEQGRPIFIPDINEEDYTGSPTAPPPEAETAEDQAANQKETTSEDEATTPHLPASVYRARIGELKEQLEKSEEKSISRQVTDPDTGLITLEYAAYLSSDDEDRSILYIFSPLFPMQSTIEILSSQLVYILIITLIIALLVSLYLSTRIATPLTRITESAQRLGQGEYGITFEGANYSEIIELADTLTYTSMELAKTDSMQKDVIANVSHDLRTPLTMVISYAEMIRDISGEDQNKRSEHLQVIIDEAERLNLLVSDLLEVSRMQSGEMRIERQAFSLKTAIENILQSYTGFVEQEGYKLIFISRGVGLVTADEARIKQVISNLISNAIKYCGLDRTVEVRMTDEEGYVRCEISDHGIGIPKKDLRHIWERYYKASTNYQRSASSGLGLSIVKEILLMHGANFGVESALRKGSTFWFELKKAETEPDVAVAEAKMDGAGAEMDGVGTGAEKVSAFGAGAGAGAKVDAFGAGAEMDGAGAGPVAATRGDDEDDVTIAGKRQSHSVTAKDDADDGNKGKVDAFGAGTKKVSGTGAPKVSGAGAPKVSASGAGVKKVGAGDDDMIIIEDRASRKMAVGIYRDETPDDGSEG